MKRKAARPDATQRTPDDAYRIHMNVAVTFHNFKTEKYFYDAGFGNQYYPSF